MHSRQIYHVLDLLGDLGGVSSIFIMLLGIFIFPISHQAFYLRMMKQLFVARTSDKDLFVKKPDSKKPVDLNLSDKKKQEFEKHWTIKMTMRDKIYLFLANNTCFCYKMKVWKNKNKF